MTPPGPPQDRARRPYHRAGLHVVSRALPYLLERVADPAIPDEALSPVERAARAWRLEVLEDLGGSEAVPAARVALLDAATGTKILLDSLDRYVFELAEGGGLVSRRTRKAFAVVSDRMRVADSLTRQLQALGLERKAPRTPSLAEYIRERYGQDQEDEDGGGPPPGSSPNASPLGVGDPEPASGDFETFPPSSSPSPPSSPSSPASDSHDPAKGEIAPPSEIAAPGGAEGSP